MINFALRTRLVAVLLATATLLFGTALPAQAGVNYPAENLLFGQYDWQISHFQWKLDGMPPPQIVVNYQAWEQNPATLIQFTNVARRHDAEVFAELGSTGCQCGNVSLYDIADGRYDSYLRSFAKAIAAFKHPVLLTWDHEMNGTWYPWGAENYRPSAWVAGWRHVYNVIHPIARNAVWIWAPNTEFGAGAVAPYWPGAQYVNEWGLDCYLAKRGQTFRSQCAPTVAQIRHLTSKPGLLAETGIENKHGRAPRVTQLAQAVAAAGLTGLIWFDKGGSYLYSPGERAMAKALR
jgi:hypothetical protein